MISKLKQMYRNYIERKSAEIVKDYRTRLKRQRARAYQRLEEDLNEMLSRPCTINNGHNCFKDCVHFGGGFVKYYRLWLFERSKKDRASYYEYHQPYCKLWKK